MKKNYISPEVEMTKFEEIDKIMSASIGIPGLEGNFGVGDIPGGSNWE